MVSQVPANPLVRRKAVKKVTKKFKKPQWDLRPSVPVSVPSRASNRLDDAHPRGGRSILADMASVRTKWS